MHSLCLGTVYPQMPASEEDKHGINKNLLLVLHMSKAGWLLLDSSQA